MILFLAEGFKDDRVQIEVRTSAQDERRKGQGIKKL
jgi:hypothetical protein